MATFFGDSFEPYSTTADMSVNYWDGSSSIANTTFVAGRFAGSRALRMGAVSNLTRTSGSNDVVHHLSFAFLMETIPGGTTIYHNFQLLDGATVQCCLAFRSDGAMVLLTGAGTGTTLCTYTGAVTTANVWNQFEAEITINNTTGRLQVRKNGNSVNDFDSGATLDTQNSANAYANKLTYNISAGAVWNQLDDFLWRADVTAPAWGGDTRCFARMAAADSGTPQWTRSGSVVPVLPPAVGGNGSVAVNTARYLPFTASATGTVATVTLPITGAISANLKCAIFSNSSGSPATVLGTSTALGSPGIGTATFSFGTAVAVTAGTQYWVAYNADAGSGTYSQTSAGNTGFQGSATYASWPANNPTGLSGISGPCFTVVVTPTTLANAQFVSEPQQDGTNTYVYSSTVGQSDLYTSQPIAGTPALILGVTTRGLFQKTDAGTRNVAVQLQSGGTNVQSASTALNTTWGWIARNDLVDPATGAPWTASGVNNATFGAIVTA